MADNDALALLFAVAEKRSQFQDWPWPGWDAGVNHPILSKEKTLNFFAGAGYAYRCLRAEDSPSLAAALGSDVVKAIRSWDWAIAARKKDYANDACNLAVFHKGAIRFLNDTRDKIPKTGEEHWMRLHECIDDLEKNVHIQFVTKMQQRIDRPTVTMTLEEFMDVLQIVKASSKAREFDGIGEELGKIEELGDEEELGENEELGDEDGDAEGDKNKKVG